MRDDQGRQLEAAQQLLQLDADRRLGVGVERGKRLVEQQDPWFSRERAREGDPLALAAGELARSRRREVGDAKALEKVVDAFSPAEGDVLAHAQVWKERVLLEDEADPPPLRREEHAALDVDPGLAVQLHATSVRAGEPGDHAQDRRLAGTGRPDERDGSLDGEPEAQLERAKTETEVRREGCHGQ